MENTDWENKGKLVIIKLRSKQSIEWSVENEGMIYAKDDAGFNRTVCRRDVASWLLYLLYRHKIDWVDRNFLSFKKTGCQLITYIWKYKNLVVSNASWTCYLERGCFLSEEQEKMD